MNPQTIGSDASPESPWLGLRSFNESSAAYFFGRGKELSDLIERVIHKPLTVLFGQSGWGKTSLLQAGLIPRLRSDGFLPVPVRLVHDAAAASLEFQVIHALAGALTDAGYGEAAQKITHCAAAGGPPGLWLIFHDPVFGLAGRDSVLPCPVFIFDQFEEIFTQGEKPEQRARSEAFREALAAMIENRPATETRRQIAQDEELADRINYQARHYRTLLTLRFDFLHSLERWRRHMPSVMENRMELRLLGGPAAFEAVVRPGQMRSGMPPIIPDDLGRDIVRFVAGVSADVPLAEIDAVPPLLSLVCAELNAQRIEADMVQVSRSQFEGKSTEILDSFYERSFDEAAFGTRLEGVERAPQILRAARTLVEDRLLSADGFRESVAFDTMLRELSAAAGTGTAREVLSLLIERRLLSVDERGGVQRLELTHDVLTRIAKASRDARTEKEAVENARLEQEKAEAETRKAIAEKVRLRKLAIVAAVCALIATAGAAFGIAGMIRARRAAEEAERGFNAARAATDSFLSRIAGDELAYVPGIQGLREEEGKWRQQP